MEGAGKTGRWPHPWPACKADHFDLFGAAFIEALHETGITDGYSEDAWRAILAPALNYMKSEVASTEQQIATPGC